MKVSMQGKLHRLARRLSVGRVLRYLDLWARYLWRRMQSAFANFRGQAPDAETASEAAALAVADVTTAKRIAVASWFPLDLANARLHRAMLAAVAEARADLGLTAEILDCVQRLKRGCDLSAAVEEAVASGDTPQAVNTALYVLLLRRLPAPSELTMIASRDPRHALIAIRSGDEYRKQGRRTLPG